MKISASAALFLASAGSASAFVANSRGASLSPLAMSDPNNQWDTKAGVLDTEVQGFGKDSVNGGIGNSPMSNEPPAQRLPTNSKAIPFMARPKFLDGSFAGDVGFDPLGFADSKANLINYREAEIKHARLAMLAAAGWPLSELWDKPLANILDMEVMLDESGRVPSVLNGGMGKIGLGYWVGCIVLAGAIDAYGSFFASKKAGYTAGDLGFDPFGLYPKDEKGRKRMQLAEIKNGRVAMVAITAFAFQEFAAHTAVIDQVPFLFKPIWTVLGEQVPGYFIPEEAAQSVDAAIDTFSSATTEAASTFVEPAAIVEPAAVVEAIPAAPVEAIPAAPVEAITAAPPMEAVTAPPASDITDLEAAKNRIAELESRLAKVESLVR